MPSRSKRARPSRERSLNALTEAPRFEQPDRAVLPSPATAPSEACRRAIYRTVDRQDFRGGLTATRGATATTTSASQWRECTATISAECRPLCSTMSRPSKSSSGCRWSSSRATARRSSRTVDRPRRRARSSRDCGCTQPNATSSFRRRHSRHRRRTGHRSPEKSSLEQRSTVGRARSPRPSRGPARAMRG